MSMESQARRWAPFLALAALLTLAAGALSCAHPSEGAAPTPPRVAELILTEAPPPAYEILDGEVASGEPLGPLLQRLGVPGGQATGAVRALADAGLNMRLIRPGRPWRLQRSASGELLHFEYDQAPGERYHVDRSPAGTMRALKEDAKVEMRTLAIRGEVEGTLSGAIHRAGEGNRLTQLVVDVFQWDLNFYSDTRKGDGFEILYTKEFVNGEPTGRYGEVIAATYTGSFVGERGVFLFGEEYFDAKGRYARKNFLTAPLDVLRVTSNFGQRFHPIHKTWKKHTGVDYGANRGTPVWSVSDGTVSSVKRSKGGYGNHVRVRHANGYETLYAHLNTVSVVQGQRVKQKGQIGTVGSTGSATGPHLHFEVTVNGNRVNPANQKMIPGRPIPKERLPAYEARVADLRAELATRSEVAPTPELAVARAPYPLEALLVEEPL